MMVKEIREKLPIKNVPDIIGEPNYKAINKVREVLYANVAAILTTLGGGYNGHIGLIMDVSVYANVSTPSYTRRTEIGPYAQHGPGDSAAALCKENTIHKEIRRIYNLN